MKQGNRWKYRRQRIDWKEAGGGKSLITDMCEQQIDKNQSKEHTGKTLNALNPLTFGVMLSS